MQPSIRSTSSRAGERPTTRQPQLGQDHTAEGDLDLSAIYVVHHGIRRDLRDFALAVPATPLTQPESWAALRRRWTNLTTAMGHHTRVEDAHIWPEIALSLGNHDAAARDILAAMAAEHARIQRLLDAVTRGFDTIGAQPAPAVQRQLVEDLRQAREAILAHLAREEREALPLMQSHLSNDQWAAVQRVAAKVYGLADLRFAVPWSAREIPADQFPIAFAHGGLLVRVLLALTRGRFDRDHRAAFRHVSE